MTYIDEVHAVGLYGDTGAGVAEQQDVAAQIDIIQGTFAKAFGVIGGYIAAKSNIIDTVRSYSADFIFTTSLPPVISEAAYASLQYLQRNQQIRQVFFAKVQELKAKLGEVSIKPISEDSHIISILVGDSGKCKEIADKLLADHNIYIQPINYPTVPKGKERLRITISPQHSSEMIGQLVTSLKKYI